jgi:Zn-dependent peptidase ImmA (M78 family)
VLGKCSSMTSIRSNKFVRQIMSEVNEADPYVAVRSLVGRYRCPGESLEKVAERLRVRKITVEPMRVDGGVYEDTSGLQIKLNSSSPLKRRRFTLAHELGHLILASGGSRGARRSHASTELERACDAVAAELLMPFDEVRSVVPRESSIDGLLALGDRFGVSLHAATVRVYELGLWNESVGFWRWDGSAQELWFVGRRPWPEKTVYLDAFARAIREGGTITTSEIIQELERGAFPVSLSVRRLGRDFLIALLHGQGRSASVAASPGRGGSGTGKLS